MESQRPFKSFAFVDPSRNGRSRNRGGGEETAERMTTAAAIAAAALLPRSLIHPRPPCPPQALSASALSSVALPRRFLVSPVAPSVPPKHQLSVLRACSNASFNESDERVVSKEACKFPSQNSILLNLVQEIEPLDMRLIQKDVPASTVDAMKRTISGMLGLLPSNRFNVIVESWWDELFKVLVSSVITGYTMRNAEYMLCLERTLNIREERTQKGKTNPSGEHRNKLVHQNMASECGGEMTPEAEEYIQYLQARLNSAEKELHDAQRKNSALQMQQSGVENNDLLDYMRSLQPEKVSELSALTCPEVEEMFHSVVHGLLATLSTNMHVKPPHSQNAASGTLNSSEDEELVEKAWTQLRPAISVQRDYLARLLYWCMLLGHYIRGLERRLELSHVLRLFPNMPNCSLGSR